MSATAAESNDAAGSRRRLQIVGAGLLGTSIGLALTQSEWDVWLRDADAAAEELGEQLGAGRRGWSDVEPDLVLLAVPPSALPAVLADVAGRFAAATITDVASIKVEPQQTAERLGLADRFVGSHPMAGRERSGGSAAQADLFDARPWALCVAPGVDAARVQVVERLIRDSGADVVRVDAASHDAAVALVSHLPHVAACAVASQLTEAGATAMTLAGQGLRDTVRVAGGDPALWVDILGGNADAVAPLVERLASDLGALATALRGSGQAQESRQVEESINQFLSAGRQGFEQIPGKHGAPRAEYAVIPVVIPDEPGALARLFTTVAKAGASVEDLSLEHSPGHPVGIVEISVRPEHAESLVAALAGDGWAHH